MEFPHLGKNCSENSCKQLDFLPMKCDACQKIFCKEHFQYVKHNCAESYKKDNQVPVCPLCNTPIPVRKGESPDVVVGQHIDSDCQSDPAKQRRKVYTNRCSKKGCKVKELVPVTCDKCLQNFCLKHRHENDHACTGFQGSGRGINRPGAAAIFRSSSSSGKPASKTASSSTSSRPKVAKPSSTIPQQGRLTNIGRDLDRERRERQNATQPPAATFQGGMTEDEAMARALALSMENSNPQPQETQNPNSTLQEQEDLALAQAIAASEEEAAQRRRRQQNTQNKSTCRVA